MLFNIMIASSLVMSPATAKLKGRNPAATQPTPAAVKEVLAAYRQAPAISAKVKKTITQEILGTESKSSGDFYFSKGKMRMDLNSPERVVLVYDGQNVWVESPQNDTKVNVQKIKISDFRKSDSVLAALFSGRDVLKDFDQQTFEDDEGKKIYTFSVKNKKTAELTSLEIVVENKNLIRIAYVDQLDNKVAFDFSDIEKGKVPADKFKYVPPKGADISEM